MLSALGARPCRTTAQSAYLKTQRTLPSQRAFQSRLKTSAPSTAPPHRARRSSVLGAPIFYRLRAHVPAAPPRNEPA